MHVVTEADSMTRRSVSRPEILGSLSSQRSSRENRFAHSPSRAFVERKLAEVRTKKEAVRALKRRISDAVY
jgi:hypothetical protein